MRLDPKDPNTDFWITLVFCSGFVLWLVWTYVAR